MAKKAKPAVCLDAKRELVKRIDRLSHRHSHWKVFQDFVEMSAIALSNGVDLGPQRDAREKRYLQIVKEYKPEEVNELAEMLGVLVMDLETGPTDVLGSVYHELELHNKWAGQYFTPFTICEFMAKMTLADSGDLKEKIEARGFVRAAEPSCGSGAMMIALALGMKAEGINYQQDLHVTATDVDLKCVHMCFIQSSLLGIPAVIIHGNSLTLASLGRGASDLLLDERD